MVFTGIKSELKREKLTKLLLDRQDKYIPDDRGTDFFYDTLQLTQELSGKELRKFYKLWFKQVDSVGSYPTLRVNARRFPHISGKWACPVLVSLIKSGFLTLNTESGKASIRYEGDLRLKRQFTGYSYLKWSGKND